ncbi:phytoene desaturase family protein [Pseudemcibacter aquimaris]|uniref:phytoene desaturase family protein n=1 Tax=Pseudemcibacter aquimaris TaxID=2857064 RepID=UPI002011D7BF|nr:NAD(P)/FAD-dependent oxidoreductase [Pseudemcibacter aquimaris]MCC3861514.1 NAD(P)/FAD-dependent oxidoreductase [Pseudemcibacter aquimaris]WDU58283.1 NAD(P)/FAD-dependent oxidoreductase [Pseudemcibacter aquimaris]
MKKYDVIVVGSGHNGLTNAAFLGKAGLDVLVLEKNDYIGGATVSRNLHEDWKYSNCSYLASLFRPEIYRQLNLAKHGLQVVTYNGGFTVTDCGDYLGSYSDHEVMRREIRRHSPVDVDAYDRYYHQMAKWCRFIRPMLLRTPPDPTSFKFRDLDELRWLGKKFLELGPRDLHDFMKFFTVSVGEFLDEFFESDLIKAHKAGSAVVGTNLGAMSPGTAYVLLHHYMGDVDGAVGAWGFPRGGMGAMSGALAGAVREHGGEIRTSAGVDLIMVKNGKVRGVVLESGEEIYADRVVSNLDAKKTFLGLLDPKDAGDKVVKMAKRYKSRGSSGKLNIALNGVPEFSALPKGSELIKGDFHVVDNMEAYERGYDEWKEGKWSSSPYLDLLIPTLTDPTMAPPGKHYMTCFVQYCPARVEGKDWTPELLKQFGDNVINTIAKYSPNFKDLIEHVEIRSGQVIDNEIGLTEGNIFQGELSLNQLLFNRPFHGCAQYRGPVNGLYLSGSTTHPGGGVMGAPGANSAREILMDMNISTTVPEDEGDD